MDKLKKLKKLEVASEFSKLSKDSLAVFLVRSYLGGTGGEFCGVSDSSCDCDATAICNCPPTSLFDTMK